ncbi:MAG TPA: response regulator transcription factor [Baekduia sp.]|nr:response regulator transcription factor [Baekduia sp.]
MTDVTWASSGSLGTTQQGAGSTGEERPPTLAFAGGGALLREALGWWLRATGSFEPTGSHETLWELIEQPPGKLDVVLVDARLLPDPAATDALAQLPGGRPRLVLLAPALDASLVRIAASCRASGVVLETDSAPDVLDALRHVHGGRVVYPAGWQELAAETDVRSPVALLSQRQLEVLRLVADGRRNEEIAATLFVSQNTVKFHIHEIYSKLGVRNRVQAAQMLLAEDGR